MGLHQLPGLLRRLGRETAVGSGDALPDRTLLARFAGGRDGAAFAALVARHGPMVLGVCRRVLADGHAAEDAFQATFLVLARRAGAIRNAELLGNWLYGVAYRAASKARVAAAKRRAREPGVPARPAGDPLAEITARESVEVLDRELQRLPAGCRAALVACYLEGKTRPEAAAELGWSPATLGRRLERGRALLRARMARRGLAPALTLFPAGVPTALAGSTVTAALGFAAGTTPAAPHPGSGTAALAEGVLRTMPITKCSSVATLFGAAVLVMAGLTAGAQTGQAPHPGDGPADPPKAVPDELPGTWTLVETHRRGQKLAAADVWLEPPELVIVGKRVTLHAHPGTEQATVESDPRATPKTFTFTWRKPWVGIYAVAGDTLTLCFNPANGIRPTDFTTPPDSERVRFVYKRAPAGPGGAKPAARPSPVLFKGHAAPVRAAAFSADGRTLVTTDTGGTIKVWDAGTGEGRSTIRRFSAEVTQKPAAPVPLAVSPDGGTLATALGDDVPRLWNAATGRERTVIRREPEAGLAMTFSPDGRTLAFLSRAARRPSARAEFWDVDTERNGERVGVPREVRRTPVAETGRGEGVLNDTPSMTYSPDGTLLAAVAGDGTVVLWETATGKESARIAEFAVKADPPKDQDERGWPRLLTEEQVRALGVARPFSFETGVAFSPDGRTLAVGGKEVTLWDARTGKKKGALPGRAPGGFARVAFSADGKTLTSASPASAPYPALPLTTGGDLRTGARTGDDFVDVWVRRWDVGTGRETAAAVIRAYDGDQPKHGGFVALSPDLMTMAAAGPDNAVRVWDVSAALRAVPAKPDSKPRP